MLFRSTRYSLKADLQEKELLRWRPELPHGDEDSCEEDAMDDEDEEGDDEGGGGDGEEGDEDDDSGGGWVDSVEELELKAPTGTFLLIFLHIWKCFRIFFRYFLQEN